MSYFINHVDGRIDHADTLDEARVILRKVYGSGVVLDESGTGYPSSDENDCKRFLVWPSRSDAEFDDGKMVVAILECSEET